MDSMNKVIAMIMAVTVIITLVLCLFSCGEEKDTEDSQTYNSIPNETTKIHESGFETHATDTSCIETSETNVSGSETNSTETSAAETDSTYTPVNIETLTFPESKDISGCSVVPSDYSDHSGQLEAMGYKSGTDEYALYDALLDISCKAKLYLQYFVGFPIDMGRLSIGIKYYLKYRNQIEAIVTDLLYAYDIGYPANETVRFNRPGLNVSDKDLTSIRADIAIWQNACAEIENALNDLKADFSSDKLKEYEYANTMLLCISETMRQIEYIKPYTEDMLCSDVFETHEEYDEKLGKVRLTIKTTCRFNTALTKTVIGEDTSVNKAKVENYTVSDDGTSVLTLLWDPEAAMRNTLGDYSQNPAAAALYLYNDIGLGVTYYYHSGFPFASHSDEYWNSEASAENSHLDKALKNFFFSLKGTNFYTYRDLYMIGSILIGKSPMRDEGGNILRDKDGNILEMKNSIQLYLKGCAVFEYPEHFSEATDPLNNTYLTDDTIEGLTENDLLLFLNVNYRYSQNG